MKATLAPAAPPMSDGAAAAREDRLLDKPRWPPGRQRGGKPRGGPSSSGDEGVDAEETERTKLAKERNYAISQCSTVEEVRLSSLQQHPGRRRATVAEGSASRSASAGVPPSSLARSSMRAHVSAMP